MTTPMGLTLPTVSVTIGPDWATLLNTDISTIETHDHSSGKGNPIPASALNMNGDVSWNPSGGSSGNNITGLRSARFVSQSALLGSAGDAGCLSNVLGDLYWNYTTGSRVKITSAGSLNASGLASNTWSTLAVVADHVIGVSDTDVFFECTSAAPLRITLPDVVSVASKYYVVYNSRLSTAVVTVQSHGGTDPIDDDETGSGEVTIEPNGTIIFISSGTNWRLLRDSHQLRGAMVPDGTAVTTGNVLQVSGARQLAWGPIHLDLGANYVTGLLPPGNMTDATLVANGIVRLAGDLAGTAAAPRVTALTGASGAMSIASTAAHIHWVDGTASPEFGVADAAAGAGVNLTIHAQKAGTIASAGGRLKLQSGSDQTVGETASRGIRFTVGALDKFDITSPGSGTAKMGVTPLSAPGSATVSALFAGQDGSGAGNNGGNATLQGGASGGGAGVGGASLVGGGSALIQSTPLTATRSVVGICRSTQLSTAEVPGNMDGALFIGTCGTTASADPANGALIWFDGTVLRARLPGSGANKTISLV